MTPNLSFSPEEFMSIANALLLASKIPSTNAPDMMEFLRIREKIAFILKEITQPQSQRTPPAPQDHLPKKKGKSK